MRTQYAMTGMIESMRYEQIEVNQSGIGAVTGAVLGGVAGNAVEKATTGENAVEMLIQLTSGSRIEIVQTAGSQGLMPGNRVNLLGQLDANRVTLKNG